MPALVDYLEGHPDAVLAFSGIDVVDDNGRTLWAEAQRDPRVFQNGPWTLAAALRMMMFSTPWRPQSHGVVRRERVVGAGLFIRPTTGNVEPEIYWVFALGLLGAVRFVPECSYRKCLHGANISFRWGARRASHVLDGITVPSRLPAGFRPEPWRCAARPAAPSPLGRPAHGRLVHAGVAVAVGSGPRPRQTYRSACDVRTDSAEMSAVRLTRLPPVCRRAPQETVQAPPAGRPTARVRSRPACRTALG